MMCEEYSGKVCFGKFFNLEYDIMPELRQWVGRSYIETVQKVVNALDFSKNFMSICIYGDKCYQITDLTNDDQQLNNCINLKDFYIGGGEITPGMYNDFRNYESYHKILEWAKLNKDSDRRTLGGVVTQFSISKREQKEAKNIVKYCGENGIDIITIGLKVPNTKLERLLNENEVRELSTKSEFSVLCTYDSMQNFGVWIARNISALEIEKLKSQIDIVEKTDNSFIQNSESQSNESAYLNNDTNESYGNVNSLEIKSKIGLVLGL